MSYSIGGEYVAYEGPFVVAEGSAVYAKQEYNGVTTAISAPVEIHRYPLDTPTIGDPDGNNIVELKTPPRPLGVTDTYWVRYTTDGSDPVTSQNAQELRQPGGTIDITNLVPPITITAVTRGTTCPDEFSAPVSKTITSLKVPTPVITFDQPASGQATVTCSMNGATIMVSIDGGEYFEYGGPFDVTAGQTVRAYATNSGANQGGSYVQSDTVTEVYVPGGQGGSGVYNDQVVLLDDREEHSWSYYSDGDQPIHSLNPKDVKITYFGNGITMKTNADYTDNTSSDDYEASTGAAVGCDAPAERRN